jgi:hypothetical protein
MIVPLQQLRSRAETRSLNAPRLHFTALHGFLRRPDLSRDVPQSREPASKEKRPVVSAMFDTTAETPVDDAGFIAACSTNERFRLRRVGLQPGDSLTAVERKLDGAYDWIASKEALGAFRRALLRWGR